MGAQRRRVRISRRDHVCHEPAVAGHVLARHDGRRADVELRLPADGAYVSVLRTTTAGLAARLDFTIDDIEDLRIAVDAGQASPGNLAYLDDRIQVAAQAPQRYGTQIACTDDGPVPATPLADADAIEQIRAEADLPPYADYLAEMAEICAQPE